MANYTRKAILSNFQQMLMEKPFDKITVSALVERCEISSNTFYYHFRDIYDLLDVWLELQKDVYMKGIQNMLDWPAYLKSTLKAMKQHSVIVYHISDSISRERMERFLFSTLQSWFDEIARERTADYDIPEETVQELSKFYCYMVFTSFLRFLWNKMNSDIDKEVDRLCETFYGVTEYVIPKNTGQLKLRRPEPPAESPKT